MDSCYMCDKKKTSVEHVPPRCFFPKQKDLPSALDYRKNLITVPACDVHNLNKSKDDEYLCMVIASYYKNNLAAQRHFSKQVIRSIKKYPAKLNLLKQPSPINVDGQPTGAFPIDKERFDRSMACIARAIYFHHYNEKWVRQISIQTSELLPIHKVDDRGVYFSIQQHISTVTADFFKTARRFGNNQEIFYYQIHRDKQSKHWLIRMVFYEGFVVVAYSPTFDT